MAYSTCEVREVGAETSVDDPLEIPVHLKPDVGSMAIQLRSTVSRVCVGAGLARRTQLLDELRAASSLPLSTSPAGGTVVVTGPGVLGISAIGVPPPESAFSLDWGLRTLAGWLAPALATFDIDDYQIGKIEGAWCPGFSDIAIGGRKLIGLGFRVTREWVALRGVMPVLPYSSEELAALASCHRLIGLDIDEDKVTSLQQCTPQTVDVDEVISRWRDVVS